jgi:hypothetical protein
MGTIHSCFCEHLQMKSLVTNGTLNYSGSLIPFSVREAQDVGWRIDIPRLEQYSLALRQGFQMTPASTLSETLAIKEPLDWSYCERWPSPPKFLCTHSALQFHFAIESLLFLLRYPEKCIRN